MRALLSASAIIAATSLAGCGPSREQSCKILDTQVELQRIEVEMALVKGDFAEGRNKVSARADDTARTDVRDADIRQIRDRLVSGFRAVASALALREAAVASDDRERRREIEGLIEQRRRDVATTRAELMVRCGGR